MIYPVWRRPGVSRYADGEWDPDPVGAEEAIFI